MLGARHTTLVYTDHEALVMTLNSSTSANGWIAGYQSRFEEMNIMYCHMPGCENINADCLSYLPVAQLDPAETFGYHRGIDVCVGFDQEENVRSCRT